MLKSLNTVGPNNHLPPLRRNSTRFSAQFPALSPALVWFGLLLLAMILAGCTSPTQTEPAVLDTPREIILYDWEGDMPESILEAFTAETGIQVKYEIYSSQEEALEQIRKGKLVDVLILENQLVPSAVKDHLLAEIDYHNVPNFKNVSANFRDLVYDPGNQYTIPYSWGTTGIVVRSDLISGEIQGWKDLWDANYTGKVVMWTMPRYTLGVTLQMLGYSANSENRQELEQALNKLLEIKSQVQFLSDDEYDASDLLIGGQAVMTVGWAYDAIAGREINPNIEYVLPTEGTLLWGDNFTIPSNSQHKAAAEKFINFFLQPKISAEVINESYYWIPNDASPSLVAPDLLADPIIFPPAEDLKQAEILLPLTPAGDELYAQIWERFLQAQP